MINENKVKILIADDAIQIVHRLMFALRSFTREEDIDYALSGAETLKKIESFKPLALLLDLHLHDMNGIAVLKEIKEKHPEIKVFVLTNNFNDFYRKQCLKSGADGFFDKSNEFNLAIEEVRKLKGLT